MAYKWIIDYNALDGLTIKEIQSLLKSNRISWEVRSHIRFILYGMIIKGFVPVIACSITAKIILNLLDDMYEEKPANSKEGGSELK